MDTLKLYNKLYGIDQYMLTGRRSTHVVLSKEHDTYLHPDALSAFSNMYKHALKDGFKLSILSGFRSIERQIDIWDKKFTGKKVLLDNFGNIVDTNKLEESERINYMLKWISVPGMSRHHWGSDIDIYDINQVDNTENVSLLPNDYASDGRFYNVFCWLEAHAHNYEFYRPYIHPNKGLNPEPWHWSFRPLASKCEKSLSLNMIRDTLKEINFLGKNRILSDLAQIYTIYTGE